MRKEILLIAVLLLGSGLGLAQKAEDATFHAYVDSESVPASCLDRSRTNA